MDADEKMILGVKIELDIEKMEPEGVDKDLNILISKKEVIKLIRKHLG